MIKVKTFSDYLISDLDATMEDYIADNEIRKEDIIKIHFYAALNPEDNYLYHYGKLVYQIVKKYQCKNCDYTIRTNAKVDSGLVCNHCSKRGEWVNVRLG